MSVTTIAPPVSTLTPVAVPPATITSITTTVSGKPSPSTVQTASAQNLALRGSLMGLVAFGAVSLLVL